MSDTWDDAKIREAFIYDGGESEYHNPVNGAQVQRKVAGALFDRWLAEHDAKVRAETLREAADFLESDPGGNSVGYKLRGWAARIDERRSHREQVQGVRVRRR